MWSSFLSMKKIEPPQNIRNNENKIIISVVRTTFDAKNAMFWYNNSNMKQITIINVNKRNIKMSPKFFDTNHFYKRSTSRTKLKSRYWIPSV